MQISVIICTYNRCESLRRVFNSLTRIFVPKDISWELLLVDNGSTDETKAVCAEFETQLPIRYLFERRQGKSFALNSAVANARSQFLLFTDDDVDVDENWLATYWKAACLNPE